MIYTTKQNKKCDMKFKDYLVKKASHINESGYTKINEAEEGFVAIIKGVMAYSKASSLMPGYEKAGQEADQNFIKAKVMQKTTPMALKQAGLEAKAKEADREQKKKLLVQADAIAGQIDKITDAQATIIQQKADEYTNIKTEMDAEVGAIKPDSLKSIISKQKTLADQKGKIRGLKAMELALGGTKDKARQEKLKGEMIEADDSYKKAMENLEEAEDAGAADLKEVKGIKAIETELKTFMAAGAKFKTEKEKLQAVYDSANALAEGENYDYSRSAEVVYELLLAELGMNEDELYEEGEAEAAVTPTTVLSKINACPEDDRPTLYGQLQGVLSGWKTAKLAQIDAKKAIWEKAKKGPQTKTVLLVAGATDDTITEGKDKEGNPVYTATEPGKKWKICFADPTKEGGPLHGIEAVEKELDEKAPKEIPADEVPAEKVPAEKVPADEVPAEKVPADEVPAEKVPAEKVPADEVPVDKVPADEALTAAKEDLVNAEKELAAAQSDENVGQEKIDAITAKVDAAKEKVEELKGSVKDNNSTVVPSTSYSKKIMKFEDFMSSRSNG